MAKNGRARCDQISHWATILSRDSNNNPPRYFFSFSFFLRKSTRLTLRCAVYFDPLWMFFVSATTLAFNSDAHMSTFDGIIRKLFFIFFYSKKFKRCAKNGSVWRWFAFIGRSLSRMRIFSVVMCLRTIEMLSWSSCLIFMSCLSYVSSYRQYTYTNVTK